LGELNDEQMDDRRCGFDFDSIRSSFVANIMGMGARREFCKHQYVAAGYIRRMDGQL